MHGVANCMSHLSDKNPEINNSHQHSKIFDTNRKNILCLAAICVAYQFFMAGHMRGVVFCLTFQTKTSRSIPTSKQHHKIFDIYPRKDIV